MPTKEERNRMYQLREQIGTLRDELSALEVKATQEKNSALVGRYYKYRNRYSSSEEWWLYLKITSVGDGNYPTAITFQHTSNDEIEIKTEKYVTSLDSYQEISEAEFEKAWQDLMTSIVKVGRTLQGVK